jgi:hypothetical protein
MPIRDRPAAINDSVSRDDIALVEARIEELAESIERCAKISLAAKVADAAWIALTLLGFVAFEPAAVIASLAAMIGGVVLLGSNATTWTQMQAAMRASETLRADMIGRLELTVVGGNGRGAQSGE